MTNSLTVDTKLGDVTLSHPKDRFNVEFRRCGASITCDHKIERCSNGHDMTVTQLALSDEAMYGLVTMYLMGISHRSVAQLLAHVAEASKENEDE